MRFMMRVKRVRGSGGTPTVTDGPFTETKELMGGYAVLRAKSREEAIRLGKAFTDVVALSQNVHLEIRQLPDPELDLKARYLETAP